MRFKEFLLEVSQEYIDQIQHYIENIDKLPFENLFGTKTRIVIPFITEKHREIKELIEEMKNPKSGIPYKVNLEDSTVISTDNRGNERKISIGSFLNRIKQTEYSKWWNNDGGQFSIIISRHPIDILRMSDFKHMTSCHTERGSYFKCAIHEAKGNGPIAYIVKNSDLNKIKDGDDIIQNGEIFKDSADTMVPPKKEDKVPKYPRNIDKGIVPLSRLRFRRYQNLDTKEEIAIPDIKSYGHQTYEDDFIKILTAWGRKQQNQLFEKFKRYRAEDFTRWGGSYMDNTDGELFSNFFDTHDTTHASHEEGGNIFDTWEEELEGFNTAYRNKFEHSYFDYYLDDVEGRPYVSFSGGIIIEVPSNLLKKQLTRNETQEILEELKDNLLNKLNVSDISTDNVEYNKDMIQFNLRIDNPESDEEGPDGYEDFIKTEIKELEEHYNEIKETIIYILEDLGHSEPSPLKQMEEWEEDKFKYFEFSNNIDKGLGYDYNIESKLIKIYDNINYNVYDKIRNSKLDQELSKALSDTLKNYIIKSDKSKYLDSTKEYLPGFGVGRFKPLINSKVELPYVYLIFRPKRDTKEYILDVYVTIKFNFQRNNEHKFEQTIKLIEYMDKPSFMNMFEKQAKNIFYVKTKLLDKTLPPKVINKNKITKDFRRLIKEIYYYDPEGYIANGGISYKRPLRPYSLPKEQFESILNDLNLSDDEFYNKVENLGISNTRVIDQYKELVENKSILDKFINTNGKELYDVYYDNFYDFLRIPKYKVFKFIDLLKWADQETIKLQKQYYNKFKNTFEKDRLFNGNFFNKDKLKEALEN